MSDRPGELTQVRLMCEAVVDLCGNFAQATAASGSGALRLVCSGIGLPEYATYSAAKA